MGEQAMAEMGIYKKKADPNTKSVKNFFILSLP